MADGTWIGIAGQYIQSDITLTAQAGNYTFASAPWTLSNGGGVVTSGNGTATLPGPAATISADFNISTAGLAAGVYDLHESLYAVDGTFRDYHIAVTVLGSGAYVAGTLPAGVVEPVWATFPGAAYVLMLHAGDVGETLRVQLNSMANGVSTPVDLSGAGFVQILLRAANSFTIKVLAGMVTATVNGGIQNEIGHVLATADALLPGLYSVAGVAGWSNGQVESSNPVGLQIVG